MHARIAALEKLAQVTRALTAELDHEALLKKILHAAIEVSASRAGTLFLYDAEAQALVFRVIVGGGGDVLKNSRVPVTQGIAGEAFTRQRAVIVQDAENDPRYFAAPAFSVGMQIHQLIAVPLSAQGQPLGVLEVMNKEAGAPYTPHDVELLLAFAAQSAIALENARLYGEVLRERDRILAVEAAVRHELARDLHDGPAQLLSALVMQTRLARDMQNLAAAQVTNELLQLEATASKALYQTRNILFDLRPVILEEQGLGAAFAQYVMRLKMVEPFEMHLNASTLRTRFSSKQEAAIFSITQEAVNNAKKHADAKNVWLDAQEADAALVIQVRDDGKGFDVAQTQTQYGKRGSLGLLNMRERAELANGTLEIQSPPNHGTTVTLRVPLPK